MHTQFPGLAEHFLQAEDSFQFETGLSRPSSRKATQSYTRRGFQTTVSKRASLVSNQFRDQPNLSLHIVGRKLSVFPYGRLDVGH